MENGEQFVMMAGIKWMPSMLLLTVCDIFDAVLCPIHSVVCHQLGLGDAVSVYSSGYFGSEDSSMPVWLDNVQCTTRDHYLSECSHNGWGNSSCLHSENASSVVCNGTGLV